MNILFIIYFILFDVWKLHNNFRDILDFVRLMKFFGEFNESRVCSLAQDALINRYLHLNSAEYLILCWLNHVPLKAIQKYKHIPNHTLDREIQNYMKDPDQYFFYPRKTEEETLEIERFVNAVEQMRGVGITWLVKRTKNYGHYSNRWDPKGSQ
jgi:hypothetical protein